MLIRIFRHLWEPMQRLSEYLVAYYTIIYGVWMIPSKAFNANPTFRLMRLLAPGPAWGVFAFALGVVLVLGCFDKVGPHVRGAALLGAICFNSFLGFAYFVSNPLAVGSGFAVMTAILAIRAYLLRSSHPWAL